MAHCAACHETFSTGNNFYAHRKNFRCLKPVSVGLQVDGRGVWRLPPREETE